MSNPLQKEATVAETTPDEIADLVAADATPASPSSALARLRRRREEQLTGGRTIDLFVDDAQEVFVRFRPVGFVEQEVIRKANAKGRAEDRDLRVAGATLAAACLGVGVFDGETVASIDPEDPDGTWPRMDERLGKLLGLESKRASDVARALYGEDGPLLSTVGKLVQWSGYDLDGVEEVEQGN